MKKILTLLLAFFFAVNLSAQEEKPVKVVFDVTSSDAKVHQATIRHVKFMSNLYENAEFEVVMLQWISRHVHQRQILCCRRR